jgi:hypothetical protein
MAASSEALQHFPTVSCSMRWCACLRLAAQIFPRFSLSVVTSAPASSSPAASSSRSCCACMSGVWNVERVNMPSHAKLALFSCSSDRSTGLAMRTMEQMRPCGAMSRGSTGNIRSVSLQQKM